MRSHEETVVDRLLAAYGVANDARLVERLGSKAQTISSWRKRGRVPLPVLERASEECGVSTDWLLRGGAAIAEFPRPAEQAAGSDAIADPVGQGERYAVTQGDGRCPPEGDDRLAGLVEWLRTWWSEASEEERAWLIVELRMLRGRMRPAESSR